MSCLESKDILRERRKNGRKGAREDRDGGIVCFLIVVIKNTKYKK